MLSLFSSLFEGTKKESVCAKNETADTKKAPIYSLVTAQWYGVSNLQNPVEFVRIEKGLFTYNITACFHDLPPLAEGYPVKLSNVDYSWARFLNANSSFSAHKDSIIHKDYLQIRVRNPKDFMKQRCFFILISLGNGKVRKCPVRNWNAWTLDRLPDHTKTVQIAGYPPLTPDSENKVHLPFPLDYSEWQNVKVISESRIVQEEEEYSTYAGGF